MNKGNAAIAIVVGTLILVAVGLLLLQRSKTPDELVDNSGVPCLVPNLPLVMHIHPHLAIEIDGKQKNLVKDIGISPTCERAIHTHEDTGEIHVESQIQRDYTLGDFMELWGEPIEREGYALMMSVDDQPSQEFGKLILKEKQQIKLTYVPTR